MAMLLHDFISESARRTPDAQALVFGKHRLSYQELASQVDMAADRFLRLHIEKGERIAVYLEKRIETVTAMFGAAAAGAAFVPVNPLLKSAQVAHILADCEVQILVTSVDRLRAIAGCLHECPALRHLILVGDTGDLSAIAVPSAISATSWDDACPQHGATQPHRAIDTDMAAIFYTSGSTGKAKGVVLSHRNMVAGATSVASYLENVPEDRILSVLPLSFDYGFSQLTTAFHAGATAVLLNHLFAKDIAAAVEAEQISGLAGVPPLWMQLADLPWPSANRLRYLTNSGGAMPRTVTERLRSKLPHAKLFLMYGLTEAFRSTYLPPSELDKRPDSIGKAIPNADVMVLRPDGTECDPEEKGELVHRGALVAMGYWNDPEKTAARFKPIPARQPGQVIPELAVWSGDTVRRDAEGFLYFVGRNDEMIKTSGYRVSPGEVEEALYKNAQVAEAVAIGVPHPSLGQAIVAVVHPHDEARLDSADLLAGCRQMLPAFMIPQRIAFHPAPLPRNANGKIDRKHLASHYSAILDEDRLK